MHWILDSRLRGNDWPITGNVLQQFPDTLKYRDTWTFNSANSYAFRTVRRLR